MSVLSRGSLLPELSRLLENDCLTAAAPPVIISPSRRPHLHRGLAMPSAISLIRLVCLGAALSIACTARADNWERFRGPNGVGISSDKNIPVKFSATENVRWKIKMEAGHSSPI